MKIIDISKRFIWLCAIFVIRIVFAPRKFKVPILKGLYYNFNGGFTSNQVALYDLNKANKKEYLSEFEWYKSRKINYPNSYKLNNKLICNKIMKEYVNIPETCITKENGVYKDKNNKEITLNQTIEILKKEKSLFFKPISIGKGIGIFRLDYESNKFKKDFKEIEEKDLRKILQERDNYFISLRIKQSQYLDKIYDKTSNTVRIITARYENGSIDILAAVQRIGTKSTIPVDNGSRGGLIANINLENGTLSLAQSLHNKNKYKSHPDSNSMIEGVKIPNWDMITKEITTVAKKLTDFKVIAWDILPTDDNFYVIEANNSSGVNIIQVFGGVRNKSLGNYYRKQKIIK